MLVNVGNAVKLLVMKIDRDTRKILSGSQNGHVVINVLMTCKQQNLDWL